LSRKNCVRKEYWVMPWALKGQCHEIFDLWFFSSNNLIWAPDSRVKAFSNIASDSRNYSKKSLTTQRFNHTAVLIWHRWGGVPRIREALAAFQAICKKSLIRVSGAWWKLFDEKNRRSKISWHCPFKYEPLTWLKFLDHLSKSYEFLQRSCLLYNRSFVLSPHYRQYVASRNDFFCTFLNVFLWGASRK
jgi:hypothetical protein